ncbi:Sodium/calcium exchanger protein-domain-containing protein [Truncatella angustata]|uniref:Vacuolar calcium ion transporter n=1 Tax=Truncatella angustata TaxID=152316 RepID=A0A9P8USI6_9PEZI|nr:Sodium/calcium exchanger protein-domain-containing protein [Truncatella angustata]KAH6657322.1 Sodium/calcium exchanger protein-domain-containing protein [Truncatella angustata]
MKETSTNPKPSYTDRIRSWARTHAHQGSRRPSNTLPVANNSGASSAEEKHVSRNGSSGNPAVPNTTGHNPAAKDTDNAAKPVGAASEAEGTGTVVNQDGAPQKKPNVAVRFWLNTKKSLCHSWVNVLLVFVPVGIAVSQVPNLSPAVVFAMNAIAIIPLAGLLSHATESVARKLGDAIGALLNVTFGNAVELIIFIIALVKNEIRIVQASLLGSILANLLLILGMAFFLGGLRYREQIYNSTVTQMSACLLSLSVISLVLPTAFHASFSNDAKADEQSLKISRGTSVILLLVYGIYLLFQLKSHAYMYESTPQHIIDEESTPGPAAAWLDSSTIVMLLISTALVAVCAEFMVDSIEGLVESSPLGEIFIGLIILPIVGNAAEHVTAVTVAMKNKMDLCIGVALGSSIQIAIFVTPLVVILGWIMDREMTLYFTLFETVCLFVSTFIVNFLVLDGRSNYLEGALLCATYVIIGVVAFFYPEGSDANDWGS